MAKKAAFVLFRGFEMLDFYGPVSVFGSHKLNGAYDILTVSETAGPVASSIGISTVTEYDFHTCPKPDILVLVGRPAPRVGPPSLALPWRFLLPAHDEEMHHG